MLHGDWLAHAGAAKAANSTGTRRIVRIFFLPPRKWASGLCRTTAYAIVYEARIAQAMDFTRRLAAVRRARPARCFLPHTPPKEHPTMARRRPTAVEMDSQEASHAPSKTGQLAVSSFPPRTSSSFPPPRLSP